MNQLVREYLAEIGRKGGKSKSPAKRKGSDAMRAAVNVRWSRYRAAKAAAVAVPGADASPGK